MKLHESVRNSCSYVQFKFHGYWFNAHKTVYLKGSKGVILTPSDKSNIFDSVTSESGQRVVIFTLAYVPDLDR